MLPTLAVDQAFQLWARCSTLDKAELANEALRLTVKGDIMQFATTEIDLLDPRSVDRLVSLSFRSLGLPPPVTGNLRVRPRTTDR